jgi:hypothetical protein
MLQNVIDDKDDDDDEDADKDVHNLYVNGMYNNVIVSSILFLINYILNIYSYLDTVIDIYGENNNAIDLTITDDEAKENTESPILTTEDKSTGL